MPEPIKDDNILDGLVDAVEDDVIKDDDVADGDTAEDRKEEALKNISSILNPDADDVDDLDDNDTDDSDVDNDDSAAADDDSELDVLGWDKETLEKIRAINPDLLDDIKVLAEKSVKVEPESEDKGADDTKVSSVEDTEFDLSGLDELRKTDEGTANLIETLAGQVKTLTTSLNTVTTEEQERKEKAENEAIVRDFRLANSQMDKLSKDFPVLGLEESLPKTDSGAFDSRSRAVRERAVIWNNAVGMYNAGLTGSFDDALEDSITLYKGKNAENLAMRKVVKDLKKRETKFTARPTHKQTQKKEATKGTDEYKANIVGDAMKAAGVRE